MRNKLYGITAWAIDATIGYCLFRQSVVLLNKAVINIESLLTMTYLTLALFLLSVVMTLVLCFEYILTKHKAYKEFLKKEKLNGTRNK